jgi:hypothetical protein
MYPNLLEPSGFVQASARNALPLSFTKDINNNNNNNNRYQENIR